MTTPSLDRSTLLADLQKQVLILENDLREQVDREPEVMADLTARHEAALTSATLGTFIGEQVTQAAVAWVLGTVFVRWSEDNKLIRPMLSGSGDRLAEAEDAQGAFFRQQPHATDADWVEQTFDSLRRSDAGEALFDRKHNPAYLIPMSHDGAKALIGFWRTRRPDGSLVHEFRDDTWDTRFLGDLYQDMSQAAKDKFALLQTPDFVEEFILDYTLTPALDEFGLDGFRLIDPTCGSGHFLLGAFERLASAWRERDLNLSDTEIARKALDSVHGVDINPYAVAIARFRLTLAAWWLAGVRTIEQAAGQRWAVTVAIGDSLLAKKSDTLAGLDQFVGIQMESEDVEDYPTLLDEGSYHVVVGNPPYITVSDAKLNAEYRRYYTACHRQFQLTVPFAQRFFDLARRAGTDRRESGYVGQITSNGFMKREFGTKLIKEFFPTIELTHVIDTSGAFIPGHGTPTVILVGRRRSPDRSQPVRAVLGIRGEPGQPTDPANGIVWTAITSQIDRVGSESDWVSVTDFPRERLFQHPWSLSGGGADTLTTDIERTSQRKLNQHCELIGFLAITREDDAYVLDSAAARRLSLGNTVQTFAIGAELRDWDHSPEFDAVFPYTADARSTRLTQASEKHLWPNRVLLFRRRALSGYHIDRGIDWFAYSDFHPTRWRSTFLISFAFVATHNHFVLNRGGKVFKQSAPVIKLPAETTEDDHLQLLGALNSSAGCFWMKQVCHDKGSQSGTGGFMHDAWEPFYEFTGTKLEQFPLPADLPLARARRLDTLAQQLSDSTPQAVAKAGIPTRDLLSRAHDDYTTFRARMIAEQEELDWDVYRRYGLLSDAEAASVVIPDPSTVPALNLGERAFEIVLARTVAAGETDTQWFARHNSTPITELPTHWPDDYRRVVEARIDLIYKRRDIALIERPECKRRWSVEPWDKQQERALREWLQDRLESRHLWYAEDANGAEQPTMRSVSELTDLLRPDTAFTDVARIWAADALGNQDVDLSEIVAALVDDEHVPFLPVLRYKPAGLRKRADWEHVWDLQRQEDDIAAELGKDVTDPVVRKEVETRLGTIPVPPKYGSGDFLRNSYWRHRGKLDVPKERFVSYPGATRDGDGSLLLGWAGWDHREQAHALAVLISHRHTEEGWPADRLTPLLAGLHEVLPWVKQWHSDVDPVFGESPYVIYEGFLENQLGESGIARNDLPTWRPATKMDVSPLPRRGTRRPAAAKEPKQPKVDRAFTAEQFAVVLDFAANGPLTTSQTTEVTGLPSAQARELLKQLVERGDLIQTGQRRGTRYELPSAR
ncbi:BREX-2 system adenine-specific DNA-methyltransferase PglX [Actinosynnema sp. NPDC047251]|uniref:BREX-2 system adenine-specific DNA-methyltransferase PglX n=1 Tax=Saccharothrix espanaensis TaxID=103731 RepID=UPI00030E3A8D|nr:BREX-2 system adenine-specific DNA-methyltransferase PglX [Saccharothrix espanaensis]